MPSATSVPIRLCDRRPQLAAGEVLDGLVPPPMFAAVSFDTYVPAQPSQITALTAARRFAEDLLANSAGHRGRFGRPRRTVVARGLYLDGGFGVGKTHLLASLWRAVPEPKAYVTFAELTALAGAVGFADLAEVLGTVRLLAIDEFELDDPGDAVLISTLLARLSERGVWLAATSNTLPDRLGEERFATENFLREIQMLAARFDTVRIDGPDYRHRGLPTAPDGLDPVEVERRARRRRGASLDHFDELCVHLAGLHPARYGAMLDGVTAVHLLGVRPASDQAEALRLVVLADRIYDRQLPLVTSGERVDEIFDAEMLGGGYRKKYRRATSRLVAVNREGNRDGNGVGVGAGPPTTGDDRG